MNLQFTPDGIEIQTLQEIFDELAAGYRVIYGNDINLDQDSPDGQRVGIEAKARLDAQSFAVSLYNSLDVDLSEGLQLDSIIKLSGIFRRPASQSQWDLNITTDRNLTLAADYTVQDDVGQEWQIAASVALTTGTTLVSFKAVNFGAIEGLTGATIQQSTIVIGVTLIAAPGDAVKGIEEETDEELRVRRNQSLQNPAFSVVGGMFAKLANLPGVTDVAVLENDTDLLDVVRNIKAHTIWPIVEGGAITDIVEVLAKNKTGGTGIKGAIENIFEETLIHPDGSTRIIPHTTRFDRPVLADVFITVTATRKVSAVPIDIDLIKEKIASIKYTIGENSIASELYQFGYLAGNGFVLTDLLISDDDISFVDSRLIIASGSKFTIDIADIDVTEVV
jgi:uncharacterized phage protein gp47/JayE